MLDLNRIDLTSVCEALEDHSREQTWWLDPTSGEVQVFTEFGEDENDHPSEAGLIPIDAISSSKSYQDLVDFTSSVRDPRARDLLERAIAGRGAFRRFKDTLFDFPELRESWFAFHDARMLRRALQWLAEEGVVDPNVADREIQAHPDPVQPVGAPFDPLGIAKEVKKDLRGLYGDRLRRVVLFGSWARGDAHPESDIDLLVVLDRVNSPWSELRSMDDILWRHSIQNDTVVTVLPVGEQELETTRSPALVGATLEGKVVV